MITGAIAYKILHQENPAKAAAVQAILEKHISYVDRWRDEIDTVPESQRTEMHFMLAARWADDIHTHAKAQFETRWHYINWPFKPASEPEDIRPLPPLPANILTALGENERNVKSEAPADQRAIALGNGEGDVVD